MDVVALPLQNIPSDADLYAMDLGLAAVDVQPQPAMPVAIIGFPIGHSNYPGARMSATTTGEPAGSEYHIHQLKRPPCAGVVLLAAAPGLGEQAIEHCHHHAVLGARQVTDAFHLLLKLGRLAMSAVCCVR